MKLIFEIIKLKYLHIGTPVIYPFTVMMTMMMICHHLHNSRNAMLDMHPYHKSEMGCTGGKQLLTNDKVALY